jgi:hypothetical protein
MRTTIITILLVMSTLSSFSTVRVYENYCHTKLNLSFCYDASQPDLKMIWYYKGVSSVLNDYIENKINNSELEDKVFEIQIGCGIFGGHPSIEISQNSSKYFVFIHGLTDLKYLTRIIEYFAHPDYESFVIEAKDWDELMRKNENALKAFNDRLDKSVPNIDMSFYKDRVETVFKLDKLRIDYSVDKLKMYVDTRLIGSNFKSPCPVKLSDNYIVNVSDTLKVFNSIGKEINHFATNKSPGELDSNFEMNAYSKWMNFYYFDKSIISYSTNDNKFYRLKK